MPGRGGTDGRTGCDGNGRGPPIAEPGRGGIPPPGRGGAGLPGTLPGAPGRPGAGRLRLPVGTWDAGDGAGTGGRTSIGRRGGAGGACPVRGSSTRKRSVGGTMRPVDVTGTERGGGGGAGGGGGGICGRTRLPVGACDPAAGLGRARFPVGSCEPSGGRGRARLPVGSCEPIGGLAAKGCGGIGAGGAGGGASTGGATSVVAAAAGCSGSGSA